jgi:hypothetical protein
MQTIEQELPIELECWLIRHGILETNKAPGAGSHAPIYMEDEEPPFEAWKPSYLGEEPPF